MRNMSVPARTSDIHEQELVWTRLFFIMQLPSGLCSGKAHDLCNVSANFESLPRLQLFFLGVPFYFSVSSCELWAVSSNRQWHLLPSPYLLTVCLSSHPVERYVTTAVETSWQFVSQSVCSFQSQRFSVDLLMFSGRLNRSGYWFLPRNQTHQF